MKYFVSLFFVALLAGCIFAPPKNPDPNHTHADFAVYINNEKLDFSKEEYMSTPATEGSSTSLFPKIGIPVAEAHDGVDHAGELGAAVPGHAYLHLHDGNGDVIHRHKPGLTIGDFFTSIGFTMTADCFALDTGEEYCSNENAQWQMFVNEQEQDFNPDYVFADLDSILLTYGATEEQVEVQLAALTDDACLYSRTCPERGEPPAENCIADPETPCVLP